VQKFQNQRKTRCKKSDCSSFSKHSLDQLLSDSKGSAYWPTIFSLPTWPYSSGWGYYPGGGLGLILIIVIILALMGQI
jgi:hypothetical protein